MLNIVGYDKLNNGEDGLRFAWKTNNSAFYVESAAFINCTKGKEENICGYTTSVSAGCILSEKNLQCTFCRTGNALPFGGKLSYRDIAKQNVFMVLADILCSDHPELKYKEREFAYMGQGEPGLSYDQVRRAIELTNLIMRGLNQKVHRHVFATCGIPFAIRRYISDLQTFYTERVTLHLSLHATNRRSDIMPINRLYPYQDSICELNRVYAISGEKPCVGIMLFNAFDAPASEKVYTNSVLEVINILKELDPNKCRISFCEFNPTPGIGEATIYDKENSQMLLQAANDRGFEAKLFSSFGREESSACGNLGGKEPEYTASSKWLELDAEAERLLDLYENKEDR